jgi:hypothetical protein
MKVQENFLRTNISIGWIAMLAVVLIMLVNMIYVSIFADDGFKALHRDPSPRGMNSLQIILASYAMMPVIVAIIGSMSKRAFRWIPAVYAILILLYFVLHHVGHTYVGERPSFSSHILDLVHHILAIWVIVNSIKWAKFKPEHAS